MKKPRALMNIARGGKSILLGKNYDYMSSTIAPLYENCIDGMKFILEMDRPIDKDKHIISPGGYVFRGSWTDPNRRMKFDFLTSYGYIDRSNPKLIEFEVRELDKDYSCSASELNIRIIKYWKFHEFFIYTGDGNDPEIHPVSIKKLDFICRNGEIHSGDFLLESANETLRDTYFLKVTDD